MNHSSARLELRSSEIMVTIVDSLLRPTDASQIMAMIHCGSHQWPLSLTDLAVRRRKAVGLALSILAGVLLSLSPSIKRAVSYGLYD